MKIPTVAFLGVCERAHVLRHAASGQVKTSVIGLSQTIVASVYPLAWGSTEALLFAFYKLREIGPTNIRMLAEDGSELLTVAIAPPETDAHDLDAALSGWFVQVVGLAEAGVFIGKPGPYRFVQVRDGDVIEIGALDCQLSDPGPFTEDRKAAVRSHPGAHQALFVELRCRGCESKLEAYVGLARNSEWEADGKIWYEDVPADFRCSCGKTKADLSILRRNMHALLGHVGNAMSEGVTVTQLYERSTLRGILNSYSHLLSHARREEALQEFIHKHPVLLHSFSPLRVIAKAPVLSHFKTDFVIVNHRKEMILVELEKPATRLLTKKGGLAAELQHAIDQVHDWLEVIDEHLIAVLDDLKITRQEVASVRGIIVAGRSGAHDEAKLKSLLKRDFGRVSIMTYDHLGRALQSFIQAVESE